MKNKFRIFILSTIMTLLMVGCDCVNMANYVAKSSYQHLLNNFNILASRHKNLKSKYIKIQEKNNLLTEENKNLKSTIKKYKNGFESMYK